MGNDGGSIPGRKDLVKEKPKEIKIDQEIISKAQYKMKKGGGGNQEFNLITLCIKKIIG